VNLPLTVAIMCVPVLAIRADIVNFRLTNGSDEITFSLPSNPVPSTYTSGVGFTVSDVLVTVDGVTSTYGVNFYSCGAACGGSPLLDLYIYDSSPVGLLYDAGPILFTGSDSQPVFVPGDFSLTDATHSTPMRFDSDFTLSVSSSVGVPEPSVLSWLCIIFAIAAPKVVSTELRKRHKRKELIVHAQSFWSTLE